MTKSQLRRAAKYLEIFAQIDLNSHAVQNNDGSYDWPDDPGYGFGSNYKKIYFEKRSLAEALRELARKKDEKAFVKSLKNRDGL